jgi:hypothetical protein
LIQALSFCPEIVSGSFNKIWIFEKFLSVEKELRKFIIKEYPQIHLKEREHNSRVTLFQEKFEKEIQCFQYMALEHFEKAKEATFDLIDLNWSPFSALELIRKLSGFSENEIPHVAKIFCHTQKGYENYAKGRAVTDPFHTIYCQLKEYKDTSTLEAREKALDAAQIVFQGMGPQSRYQLLCELAKNQAIAEPFEIVEMVEKFSLDKNLIPSKVPQFAELVNLKKAHQNDSEFYDTISFFKNDFPVEFMPNCCRLILSTRTDDRGEGLKAIKRILEMSKEFSSNGYSNSDTIRGLKRLIELKKDLQNDSEFYEMIHIWADNEFSFEHWYHDLHLISLVPADGRREAVKAANCFKNLNLDSFQICLLAREMYHLDQKVQKGVVSMIFEAITGDPDTTSRNKMVAFIREHFKKPIEIADLSTLVKMISFISKIYAIQQNNDLFIPREIFLNILRKMALLIPNSLILEIEELQEASIVLSKEEFAERVQALEKFAKGI